MAITPDREEDHNYHREMPEEGHEEARSNVIKRKRCSDDFVNDVALAEDNDDGNLGLELEIGVCSGGERRRKGKRCSDGFLNHVALVDDDDDGSLDLELEIGVGGGGGESCPKRKRGSEFVNNIAFAVVDDDGSLGLELEVGCGGGGESRRKRKRCSDFINHVGLVDGYCEVCDGRLELEVVGDGGESRSRRRRVCLDLNKVYDSDQEEDYEKQDHVEEAAALISSCSSSGNYTEYYDEHDEGPDWEQEVNQDDPPKLGDDHVEELAAVVVVPDETSTNHGGLGTTGIDWDHCDCDSNQYLGSPDNGQVNQDVERLVSTVEEKDEEVIRGYKDEEVIRGYTFSGGGDLSAAASDEDPKAILQVKPFNFLPDLNEFPPSDHTPKFPFMPDLLESLV